MAGHGTSAFGELTLDEYKDELKALHEAAASGAARAFYEKALTEAADLSDAGATSLADTELKKAWKYTGIVVGFVNDDDEGSIIRGADAEADDSLKTEAVNLKVDRFWVENLPGFGEHEVLLKWTARHHLPDSPEEPVTFTQQFLVRENDANASVGRPIFLSLNAPPAGVGFEFDFIYLKNNTTERFLKFLNSDAVKGGLKLITSANPAMGTLSTMAGGIAQAAAEQNNNRYILKSAYLGLDFQDAPTGVRLREGTYLCAQAAQITWPQWKFDNGRIAPVDNATGPFPYNYFVFRIEKAESTS